MSHLLVYATTDSRLHADLVIVRLKRAGIATGLISVLYPSKLRPNSTRCWIRGNVSYDTGAGEVSVSGMLGLRLNALKKRWSSNPLVDGLGEIGLNHDQSMTVVESLMGNHIVVAVEIGDESDLPAIYHTLRGLAIGKVRTADSAINNSELAPRPRHIRHIFAPSGLDLPLANPV
jgi:hypothetical protein